jgi:peptide/nickel transport system permease protein
MLAEGQSFLTTSPWVAVFPGLALMLTVLGINLLGDGLRDLLDPRLRC